MEIGLRKNPKAEIKLIIVGDSGTGKTSICHRWTEGKFQPIYKVTIMTEFRHKIIEHKENLYKIQLWDIGGQDKNRYATKVLTKGAHGFIIVCDIQNKNSLEGAALWKKAIEENQKFLDGSNLPSILLQNKCDLVDESERIDDTKLKKIAQENGYLNAFYTSAKERIGISEAMDYFIEQIVDKLEAYSQNNNVPINKERASITLNKPKSEDTTNNLNGEGGCC